MKQTLMILGLVFVMNANADHGKKYVHPSQEQISKNRSCFKELEKMGCGSLNEDSEKFRSCMSSMHETMDDHCKKMLRDLYGS